MEFLCSAQIQAVEGVPTQPCCEGGLCPCVHFSGAGVGVSGATEEGWRPQLHPQVIHGLAPWVVVAAMAG